MNIKEQLAQRVSNNMAKLKVPNAVCFDPSLIIFIGYVIMFIVQQVQRCSKSPQEAFEILQHPTWLQKKILERHLRQDLDQSDYNMYISDIRDAIYQAGKELDLEEVTALLKS